jgi:hypothetical protein
MDSVLKRTYHNRSKVTSFLKSLLTNRDIVGPDPCAFWQNVHFFQGQVGGQSLVEMLDIFDGFLNELCGIRARDCGRGSDTFVYIDDASFTGNTVINNIRPWIQETAPPKATLHVIVIAYHRLGQYYAKNQLGKIADAAGKEIDIHWWRCVELEDRVHALYINNSDVLRPRSIPDDPLVAAYVDGMKYEPKLRTADGRGEHNYFSSEAARNVLEQEFLKAGVRIRDMCPFLNKYQRPLGNMVLEALGFGTTFVTFRNCPNNAPLAFWAGSPWYPLFPRHTR